MLKGLLLTMILLLTLGFVLRSGSSAGRPAAKAIRHSVDVDPNLLALSVKVYESIEEARKALGEIEAVQAVVQDIEAGKTPSVTQNQWTGLGDDYKALAKKIREAPLPTDFDKEKYTVSLSDLKSCSTREASINKLRGFLQELKDARKRGDAGLIQLGASLSEADKARVALKYLIDVHEKLASIPVYGSIFAWDWFELNTDVSASLSDLTSALKSQQKKLQGELAKLNLYIPNLEGNLTLFDPATCSVVGKWEGKRVTLAGSSSPFSVEFKKNGTAYAGTMQFVLFTTTVEDLSVINIDGQKIEFKTKSTNLCKGEISADFTEIKAKMISLTGQNAGTCNLKRSP